LSRLNIKLSRKYCGLCGIIGGTQFIILTIIAMIIYPGGYIFWEHFFSNLGCIYAYEPGGILRGPNIPSRIIFVITCTTAAILIIPLLLGLNTLFKKTKIEKYLITIGTISGLIAAPNLSLLAIFASDVLHVPHVLTTQLFFIFYGVTIILFSLAILIDKDYENYYGYIGLIIAVFLLLYAFVFLYNAPFQKVTVYLTILWSAIQGIKLWKSK
jgi:hypothetical protein